MTLVGHPEAQGKGRIQTRLIPPQTKLNGAKEVEKRLHCRTLKMLKLSIILKPRRKEIGKGNGRERK